MIRSLLFLCLVLELRARTAIVTNIAERLDKYLEKYEKITIQPPKLEAKIPENLAEKLDRLNALTPDDDILDENEEVLSALQMWGVVDPEQLDGLARDLEQLKVEGQERIEEYSDDGWNDDDQQEADGDYVMDVGDDWDDDEPNSTLRPESETPSAMIRPNPFLHTVSAAEPLLATNSRPKILDDSKLSRSEMSLISKSALEHIISVVKNSKCSTPQPRWLSVRQLAPAANTVYFPPCVLLHRCAPDSGCCHNEEHFCAPVKGEYVAIPFLLSKAAGTQKAARMLFYNHTRCACVSRDNLIGDDLPRVMLERQNDERFDNVREKAIEREVVRERTIEQEAAREKAIEQAAGVNGTMQVEWQRTTDEPKLDEDTAPPQLRRCTCPALFRAKITNDQCTCVCDWPDNMRQSACISLSKGQEHFGMRDRVCISNGDCHPPTCKIGSYKPKIGQCPSLRQKRYRYRGRFSVRNS